MIDRPDTARRRAFSVWLRTGRLPKSSGVNGIEVKFNPWHDPRNGRFTFAGAGRSYGYSGGHGETTGQPSPSQSATRENHQSRRAAPMPQSSRTVPASQTSTQSTAGPNSAQQRRRLAGRFSGGAGGDFGGGGASGDFSDDPPKQRPVPKPPTGPAIRQASIPTGQADQRTVTPVEATPLRREVRNGYVYLIDDQGRTRKASGTLTSADRQVRSRLAQTQAGGADRRPTDDGGHYIAARFNGPTDAFNHFAQDANFNRGQYRLLEDQWARAKRAGRSVTVKIVPGYDGASKRPSVINIWFIINGHEESAQIPNEPKEKHRGK